MTDSDAAPEELVPPQNRLDDLLGYARAHAATGDTRMWVDDLERLLAASDRHGRFFPSLHLRQRAPGSGAYENPSDWSILTVCGEASPAL